MSLFLRAQLMSARRWHVANAQMIYADSLALLTFLSDVFQPVPACSTWVSSAIRADVEDCQENALEKESDRELCQLPLRENRRYRRCNARSLVAHILSRGGEECGWPGGERERGGCSEMV